MKAGVEHRHGMERGCPCGGEVKKGGTKRKQISFSHSIVRETFFFVHLHVAENIVRAKQRKVCKMNLSLSCLVTLNKRGRGRGGKELMKKVEK